MKENNSQNLSIIKFIKSIYNKNTFIPLHEPRFLGNEKNILMNVLTQHLYPQ